MSTAPLPDFFRASAERMATAMRASSLLEARIARLEAALGLSELRSDAAHELVDPSLDGCVSGGRGGVVASHLGELPGHVGHELMRKLHELGALLGSLIPQDCVDQSSKDRVLRSGDLLGSEQFRISHFDPQGCVVTITVARLPDLSNGSAA